MSHVIVLKVSDEAALQFLREVCPDVTVNVSFDGPRGSIEDVPVEDYFIYREASHYGSGPEDDTDTLPSERLTRRFGLKIV